MDSPAIILIAVGITLITFAAFIAMALSITDAPATKNAGGVGSELDAVSTNPAVKLEVKASPGHVIFDWGSQDPEVLSEVAKAGLHLMQAKQAAKDEVMKAS